LGGLVNDGNELLRWKRENNVTGKIQVESLVIRYWGRKTLSQAESEETDIVL